MKNYKTMTPEQSAYEISILMGRPVRYSRNIYADPDIEERHLKVYDRRGCAARICDDGAVVLYGKPEHNRYQHLLMTAVYQLVAEKGPAGLLPDADLMRLAAERSVRFADMMSDVDLRAFCMSCSDGNGSGTKTAADILHVAFRGGTYPEGLERAVCNGMKAYRFEILKGVREGSDEALIKDFAKETVSPYSGHLHLHLGTAQKGMFRDIDYPDIPLLVDIDLVRNMARKKGVTPEALVDDGVVEEMKNPICVIRNRKYPSHISLVLNVKGADGRFFVLNVIRPDLLEHKGLGIKLSHLSNISEKGLMTMLSYEENLVYVRRSMGNRFSSDIVDALRASDNKKGGPELSVPHGSNGEYREGLYHDDKDDVLNVVAKIVNNFENPKSFDDLDRRIAAAPAAPALSAEVAPAVEVKSEAQKNLSVPVAEGGFSRVTLKKFADKGIVTAGDIRSRLFLNDGEERFAADFGKKAYRDAMRWMDSLEMPSPHMGSPLETVVADDISAMEKRYDPMGVLREYMFPPADIHMLYLKGEAHVQAEIARRPVMEYDRDSTAVLKRKVDVTLRLEDGGIAVYARDGKRIPGKLRDILRNEDLRLRPVLRKAPAGVRNTETNTIKKIK